MARRTKDKLGSAAHIKRNTAGTSNEISFSVLDAAKMELEGQLKQPEAGSRLGRVPLFTLKSRKSHETPSRTEELPLSSKAAPARKQRSTWNSSSPADYEIARRKGRRRLHRALGVGFVVIACVAICAVVGTAISKVYQDNQGSVMSLQDALTEIANVDETLVTMNGVVDDPVNSDYAETVAELQQSLPDSRERLDAAYATIESAFETIVNPGDREAASNALGSISARIDMIDHGSTIIDQSAVAINARSNAVMAWNDIMSADAFIREAADLANENTAEGISSSREQSHAALSALNEAAYLLTLAQEAYPAADLSAFQAYVTKRIESCNHAIASDDAFLADDTATALSENDAYNQAEAEAADLASQLPESIVDVIATAFSTEMATEIEAYDDARTRAASTDAYLRTYRVAE